MGKNQNAPPPLPPEVRVAVHPPKDADPEAMSTLGDKCIAAATANAGTIGQTPSLTALTPASAAVKAQTPAANRGALGAKAALLAATKRLHKGIRAHAGWVDNQMAEMTPAEPPHT